MAPKFARKEKENTAKPIPPAGTKPTQEPATATTAAATAVQVAPGEVAGGPLAAMKEAVAKGPSTAENTATNVTSDNTAGSKDTDKKPNPAGGVATSSEAQRAVAEDELSKSDSDNSLSTCATNGLLSGLSSGGSNNCLGGGATSAKSSPFQTPTSHAKLFTPESKTPSANVVAGKVSGDTAAAKVATSDASSPSDVCELPQSEWLKGHPPTLGATIIDNARGICCFRVWGPYIEKCYVDVTLPAKSSSDVEASTKRFEMISASNDASFVCQLRNVKPGLRYHYVFNSKWNDAYNREGHELHRRDPYARQVDYDDNTCYVVDPSAFKWEPFEAPKSNKLIIYELHVGSFAKEENKSPFVSLVERLHHIKDLGFNAVELMPVMEFGGSWGYSPRLLMAPHQRYGTPEELRTLVNEAHQKGLAVIFDVVLGHGSVQMNSLWNFDGYGPNGKGGIYFEGEGDSHWGSKFAFHRKEVREMIKAALMTYAIEYNVDGIRVDAAHQIPQDFLKDLTSTLRSRSPMCFLIAEFTPEDPDLCSKAGFDSCWLHSSYYDAIKMHRGVDPKYNFNMLKAMINGHRGCRKSYQGVNSILGSHDQCGNHEDKGVNVDDRVGKYFVEHLGGRSDWHARAQCRMWISLQALSRPLPMMFMGTETLTGNFWNFNRHYDWQLVTTDENATQMMGAVRDANKLRLNNDNFTDDGEVIFTHQDRHNTIIGFCRQEQFLVVANFNESQWENDVKYAVTTTWSEGSLVRQIFNSQAAEYGGWDGSWTSEEVEGSDERKPLTVSENGKLEVVMPKWSVMVFQLKK